MEINNVMVIGAGQMGAGIAQVCAQAGYNVILNDVSQDAVQQGKQTIDKFLTRSVDRERISQTEKDESLARLSTSTQLADGSKCDLFIEAAVEKMAVKKEIFSTLDEIAPKHAVLATNTSSLPITEIASATNRPEQVIGMHFMNPVPVMKLVEIIRALQTSDEIFAVIEQVSQDLGKTAVEAKDYPGFAANRIIMPMINEAIFALHEGVASIEDIDTVMKLGMNHPMGPLTLADFIGLDTCLYIMDVLYDGFGDSKYRACPLLRQYVQAGWLGRKSGRGFYTYDLDE